MKDARREELLTVSRQLRTLAGGRNYRSALSDAWILIGEAINYGAFSGARYAVFRDQFDRRHDEKPRHSRALALSGAMLDLANLEPEIAEREQFWGWRPGDEGQLWRGMLLALAELIEREATESGSEETDRLSETGDRHSDTRFRHGKNRQKKSRIMQTHHYECLNEWENERKEGSREALGSFVTRWVEENKDEYERRGVSLSSSGTLRTIQEHISGRKAKNRRHRSDTIPTPRN